MFLQDDYPRPFAPVYNLGSSPAPTLRRPNASSPSWAGHRTFTGGLPMSSSLSSLPLSSLPVSQTYSYSYQSLAVPTTLLGPAGPAVEFQMSSARTSSDTGKPTPPAEDARARWGEHETCNTSGSHAPVAEWGQGPALDVGWSGQSGQSGREWNGEPPQDGHIYAQQNDNDSFCDYNSSGCRHDADGIQIPCECAPSHSSPASVDSVALSSSVASEPVDGYAYHTLRTNTTPLVNPNPKPNVVAPPAMPRRHARLRAPIPKFFQHTPPFAYSLRSSNGTSPHQTLQTPRRSGPYPSGPLSSPGSSSNGSYASHDGSSDTPSSRFAAMALNHPRSTDLDQAPTTAMSYLAPYPAQQEEEGLVFSPTPMDEEMSRGGVPQQAHPHSHDHAAFDYEDADGFVYVQGSVGQSGPVQGGGAQDGRREMVSLKRKATGSDHVLDDDELSAMESEDEIRQVSPSEGGKVQERSVLLTKQGRPRRKKGKAIVACAECRRLKMKCDNKAPCGSCIARGVAPICPTETLANLKGKRLVLTSTVKLHERITALEKALAISYAREHPSYSASSSSYGTSSPRIHPLLKDSTVVKNEMLAGTVRR